MKRIFPYILTLMVCSVPLQTRAEEEEVIFNPHPQITLELHEDSSYSWAYGTLAALAGYAVLTLAVPSVRALNHRILFAIGLAGR